MAFVFTVSGIAVTDEQRRGRRHERGGRQIWRSTPDGAEVDASGPDSLGPIDASLDFEPGDAAMELDAAMADLRPPADLTPPACTSGCSSCSSGCCDESFPSGDHTVTCAANCSCSVTSNAHDVTVSCPSVSSCNVTAHLAHDTTVSCQAGSSLQLRLHQRAQLQPRLRRRIELPDSLQPHLHLQPHRLRDAGRLRRRRVTSAAAPAPRERDAPASRHVQHSQMHRRPRSPIRSRAGALGHRPLSSRPGADAGGRQPSRALALSQPVGADGQAARCATAPGFPT